MDDLLTIGTRLDQAGTQCRYAMPTLDASTRSGDALIGKAEKIKFYHSLNTRL
jgi:hypothetical protein